MILPHFIDDIRYTPVFTSEEIFAQAELKYTIRQLKKGEYCFFPEEKHRYTYHVVKGLIRLYLSSRDGLEKTLFYHSSNTQFGFQGFRRDGLTISTAIAVTDCEVLVINYSDLLEYCDKHTECYLAYIEYLFQIMGSLADEVETLTFDSGARRLASLLYALAVSYDTTVSYTIDELANLIGSHRNTVSTALSEFRSKGLIAEQKRPIVVTDLLGISRYLET